MIDDQFIDILIRYRVIVRYTNYRIVDISFIELSIIVFSIAEVSIIVLY